jgi:hypothetical protein
LLSQTGFSAEQRADAAVSGPRGVATWERPNTSCVRRRAIFRILKDTPLGRLPKCRVIFASDGAASREVVCKYFKPMRCHGSGREFEAVVPAIPSKRVFRRDTENSDGQTEPGICDHITSKRRSPFSGAIPEDRPATPASLRWDRAYLRYVLWSRRDARFPLSALPSVAP